MRSKTLIYALLVGTLSTCSCTVFRPEPVVPEPDLWYYDSIVFEIAPVGSSAPSPAALEQFRQSLDKNRFCPKEHVYFIEHDPEPLLPPMLWHGPLLTAFEDTHRVLYDDDPEDRHLNVFVPYISGAWLAQDGIRLLGGLQYAPTAFAIFKPGASNREAAVLLHEFGHIIGLVKDLNRDNHDDSHPYHCANKRCVMFYTAPLVDADFDYYCRRDIRRWIMGRNK